MGEVQRRVGVAPEHGGGRHELELKHFIDFFHFFKDDCVKLVR